MPNEKVLAAKKSVVAELTEKMRNAQSASLLTIRVSPSSRTPSCAPSFVRTESSTLLSRTHLQDSLLRK